jgi:hypothetical protein
VGTPIGTPEPGSRTLSLSPWVRVALEKILPGLEANRLFQSLDSLFGSRENYTLVGSVSMHMHALEAASNSHSALPAPNDIDVVVNSRGIDKLQLANEKTLQALGLRRDKDLSHVLYVTRLGHGDLKIDVVKSATPGFAKYMAHRHAIDEVPVASLDDCLKDYRQRLNDREFIQACGSPEAAKNKIKPWLDYFAHLTAQGPSNRPPSSSSLKRRRLSFDSSGQS